MKKKKIKKNRGVLGRGGGGWVGGGGGWVRGGSG